MRDSLLNLKLFSDLNADEFKIFVNYFKTKNFKVDEIILTNEKNKKELYIILEGRVVSTLQRPGSIEVKNQEYIEGDFFGELSLFGNRSSFDKFIIAEESSLLVIGEKDLKKFIEEYTGLSVKFLTQLLGLTIQHFRNSSKFLSDIVQWGENASRRVITDELTGIYNRSFLEDALENFFNISKSNNKPLSFFMIDLDNFRQINETLGLDIGNKIIASFVSLVNKIISKHGLIARYGGDEFSILLPEADLQKALSIGEEIRSTVESFDFFKGIENMGFKITASIGISSFPETAGDIIKFKEKADTSLYQAKKLGRNRVEYIK